MTPAPAASPAVSVEVRRGAYHDSVALMQASQAVSATPGVQAALVAMATEANLELLAGMGFPVPAGAGRGDLLVAVRAETPDGLAAAGAVLEQALAATAGPAGLGGPVAPDGSGTLGGPAPARTVAAAARRGDASLALVSVPGPYAFVEAMDALEAGLSVLVFSDNVPLAQEVRLKEEAARRGLLVMGPDCGTAVVAGVGLGFANVVRPGPVGLVAASGTGAQQLMCLLDAAGVGLRACLGVGGRDLSAAVGGRSTRAALALLDADPATELVVVVSKPPAPDVAEQLLGLTAGLDTSVQLALLGPDGPDLTAAAERAVRGVGGRWVPPEAWPAPRGGTGTYRRLRGLFAGGTLCDEAMLIATARLGPIRSNIPLDPDWALPPDLRAEGHVMIDFGDDRLTRGRPHPMIDQRARLERIAAEAADPSGGVLLLDVVLGHAAHPDPAAELAPAVAAAQARAAADGHDLAVVVSLCGTEADPQGLQRQADALVAAGASVYRSNAAAARQAVALVAGSAAGAT